MKEPRNHYTPEFKAQAVQQAKDSGQPYAQTARALGIRPNILYRWQQEEAEKETGMKRTGTVVPPEEIRQLQRKVQVLEEECAILKKALAIFSKPGR